MQTVAQLIEALRAMPQDARVIVDGYEGGYDDAAVPVLIPVAIGRTSTYCGAHDDPPPPSFGQTFPIEQCVCIGGRD